jgi:hypothetical protein
VPAVSLAPATLAFAPQTVGVTSGAQPVTLTNTGTGPLNIASTTISGDFAYSTTCGPTLAAGASCNFSVTFTPIASGGRVGQLAIVDDAAGSPHIVPLSGTGLISAAPTVGLSAGALAFPNTTVGATSAPQGVTITNTGTTPLTLALTGAFEFPMTSTCPASLAPRASCTAFVAFQPQSAGTRTGTLFISSNAPTSPNSVSLAGVGVPIPTGALVANPVALTFPPVGVGRQSAALPLTITNTGNAPINVSSITVEGEYFVAGSCITIAAGRSCPLSVVFAPTATGIRDGMVLVRSDAANSVLAVALAGRGAPIEPEATLSATRLAFGNQLQFLLSPPLSATLTNTGLAPLRIDRIAASGSFVQSSNCGAGLEPGASCQIEVRMFGSYSARPRASFAWRAMRRRPP